MGFQGRWSCGHWRSYLPGVKKIINNRQPNVFPFEFPLFCDNVTLRRGERTVSRDSDSPLLARRSAPPSAAPSRLMVGHILGKKLLFYFPETIKVQPQPGSFYWFARPRVERWRTSKRCSPMSVIWWRWRRANRLQRPERARKSSCPNPGKHINSKLSCRVAAQGLFVCLQSGCMFFSSPLHACYAAK